MAQLFFVVQDGVDVAVFPERESAEAHLATVPGKRTPSIEEREGESHELWAPAHPVGGPAAEA